MAVRVSDKTSGSLRVLHVTNAWPSEKEPVKGVFVQEQVESLRAEGVTCDVIHVDAAAGALRAYWAGLKDVWGKHGEYPIVHCHHIFCIVIGLLVVPRQKLVGSFMNDGKHNVKGKLAPLGGAMFAVTTRALRWQIHKSRLPKHVDERRAACIPNGVDMSRFQIMDREDACGRLGLDPDADHVLFVSANDIRPEKRKDLFDDVIEVLQRSGYAIEPLVMTNVQREAVPDYFAAARVHLLVSDFEGSPNSVRESLASGTPVVARDVGGVAQLIYGVAGCALVGDDVDEIAAAVIEVLDRPESQAERCALRESLTERGFAMGVVARKIVSMYQKMIGDARIA